jgi:hypothetical protein
MTDRTNFHLFPRGAGREAGRRATLSFHRMRGQRALMIRRPTWPMAGPAPRRQRRAGARRPAAADGEAGCGKTQLAASIAHEEFGLQRLVFDAKSTSTRPRDLLLPL